MSDISARSRMHIKFCKAQQCRVECDDPQKIAQSCHLMDHLLDQVEDDRAHAEAERLRQRVETVKLNLLNPYQTFGEQLITDLADMIDPYEMRDGQLVRKSDGKPVTI